MSTQPRIIAWEITRRCPLACQHCRAGAQDRAYDHELSHAEALTVLDSIASYDHPPMIIWTGGEPMTRPDILDLVRAATQRHIRSVMAPCGTLVTRERLLALQDAGVMACSFSLDGATAATHDAFRGVAGAFDNVTRAMDIAHAIGMPFQINTTVNAHNFETLPAIRDVAIARGARTMDLFFLVPVGRGASIANLALDAATTERVLRWAFAQHADDAIAMHETCCPQAVRVWAACGKPGKPPSGCMAGRGFMFLSHTGMLQPCGFLDIPCGNVRDTACNLRAAYDASTTYAALRDPARLTGACHACGLAATCGGCRARAYAATGDYLSPDPSCLRAEPASQS